MWCRHAPTELTVKFEIQWKTRAERSLSFSSAAAAASELCATWGASALNCAFFTLNSIVMLDHQCTRRSQSVGVCIPRILCGWRRRRLNPIMQVQVVSLIVCNVRGWNMNWSRCSCNLKNACAPAPILCMITSQHCMPIPTSTDDSVKATIIPFTRTHSGNV